MVKRDRCQFLQASNIPYYLFQEFNSFGLQAELNIVIMLSFSCSSAKNENGIIVGFDFWFLECGVERIRRDR